MKLTEALHRASERHQEGTSEEVCALGFRPAFLDRETGIVYQSRFADGRLAPCHLLDGLPAELIVKRDRAGRVAAVKASLVCGFLNDGLFYTREQAAIAAMAQPASGCA